MWSGLSCAFFLSRIQLQFIACCGDILQIKYLLINSLTLYLLALIITNKEYNVYEHKRHDHWPRSPMCTYVHSYFWVEHCNVTYWVSLTLFRTYGGGEVDSTNPFGILEFLLILLKVYPDIGWLFLNIYLLDLGTKKIEIFWGVTTFWPLQKYWDFLKIGLEKKT